MSGPAIVPIERLELSFVPRPWAFAAQRRAEIDVHFAALKRAKPALWNGRVLLLHEHAIERGIFRGALLESDFASFVAWRDWNFPDKSVSNCFAMGALRAADGAFLLGVMASHTANAGQIYFPSGTPDPSDIVGLAVDLDQNVWREMAEETGLGRADLNPELGWTAVQAGSRIALMKRMDARLEADALRARILDHLAHERHPELADIHIVRSPADFSPAMPEFTRVYLGQFW